MESSSLPGIISNYRPFNMTSIMADMMDEILQGNIHHHSKGCWQAGPTIRTQNVFHDESGVAVKLTAAAGATGGFVTVQEAVDGGPCSLFLESIGTLTPVTLSPGFNAGPPPALYKQE
jgi:hypothetical protein